MRYNYAYRVHVYVPICRIGPITQDIMFQDKICLATAAYQHGNISSCTIIEVKHQYARLFLRWETYVQVLSE